ncbi:MAG: phosphoadenylyl-sulfate reductase [Solirubrobacterales bacterium]
MNSRKSPVASRQGNGSRPRPLHELLEVSSNGNGASPNGNGGPAKPPMIGGEIVDPVEVAADIEELDAADAIAWVIERFHPDLRFAVSFQKTSSVTIDLAHRIEPAARFFYLDTELLFPETYATRDALARHFEIEFERFGGIALDQQEAEHGANLWRRDPDACCAIRKVEVMHEALRGAECWVSGIRRVDSETRASAAKFSWDQRFGLWKLNPLADWDDKRVWNYIKERHVPYNPLHDQGYPSIGCMPCTAMAPDGDDARAGRWAGTDRTECGING